MLDFFRLIPNCGVAGAQSALRHSSRGLTVAGNTEIPGRLKSIRAALALSQKAIAAKLGIAYRTWQDIETGKNVPSGETLLKIASLGFNPGWVLTGIEPMLISEQRQIQAPNNQSQSGSYISAPELLAIVTDAIQRAYKDAGAGLPALDLGRLSAEMYNTILAAGVAPDEWRGAVKMAANQLRREIAATAADASSRKREAS